MAIDVAEDGVASVNLSATMSLPELAKVTKARLLKMHYDSHVGHIGGNLSCIDILLTLYHRVLSTDDNFVLSKGHSAGALYAALWSVGRLTEADLQTFHHDGTILSAHPAPGGLPDIPFATGSLGHGFSLANGLALAKKMLNDPGRVYCLTSDGEWQEGATWEALIFALHRRLDVTVIVDANRLQGFGATDEVAGMGDLIGRIRGFGAHVLEVDGHDHGQVEAAATHRAEGLKVVYANTYKGNGVSFMSGKMEWHYLPLTDDLYATACAELGVTVNA